MNNKLGTHIKYIVVVFSFSLVLCIAQTNEWIHFKSNPYLTTMVNAGNTLWIGTYDEGLYKFDKIKESFTEYNTNNSPLPSNI